ncbi:MAG: gliding motility protein GldN [Bacteroidetes bacterium]|nr:gliding motility protein GldN [Bacteroidota bacterium]
MKKYIILFSILFTIIANSSNAQGVYDDWTYGRQAVKERQVIRWPYLREADVMYAWRVERIIDVREKMNICMAWPKNPLFTILETSIMKDKSLTVYWSDSLNRPMTAEDISKRVNYETNIQVQVDPNDPYNLKDSVVQVVFDWAEVKRYKIIEDWIFDKKESRFVCRIIAIAPMFKPYEGGAVVPEQAMCYIRYHDNSLQDTSTFRQVCVNQEVYNRFNDAARITFDDFFEMRMFSSYIIKESKVILLIKFNYYFRG